MSQKIEGFVTKVSDMRSGTNSRGDWTVQHVFVGTDDISVWSRGDMNNLVRKFVHIEGVTTNKKGELQLESGKGSIDVKDVPKSAPDAGGYDAVFLGGSTPVSAPPTYAGKPTQDGYEVVLARAIDFISNKFAAIDSDGDASQSAVAEVVKGYMVAFSRGDFVVETAQPISKEPHDEIPFGSEDHLRQESYGR